VVSPMPKPWAVSWDSTSFSRKSWGSGNHDSVQDGVSTRDRVLLSTTSAPQWRRSPLRNTVGGITGAAAGSGMMFLRWRWAACLVSSKGRIFRAATGWCGNAMIGFILMMKYGLKRKHPLPCEWETGVE